MAVFAAMLSRNGRFPIPHILQRRCQLGNLAENASSIAPQVRHLGVHFLSTRLCYVVCLIRMSLR